MYRNLILDEFLGMNRSSSRNNMEPNYAWDIHNGYIKKDIKKNKSVIKQRLGITKFNGVSFTNDCKYAYEAKWNGGGTDVLIREGTRWAKFDGVDTFDDLDTGRANGAKGMAVMFDNEVIMADGGKLRKCTAAYNVSDLSVDAAQPTHVSAVHVHNHKVWCNDDDYPMEACYLKTDAANAADAFSASGDAGRLNFARILPEGDRLIGFSTFAHTYIVFRFTKYVVIYTAGTDPTEFNIQQIIPISCLSGHSALQVGNDLVICSLDGMNSLRSSITNQDLDTDDLSRYIAPLYRDFIKNLADKTVVHLGYCHSLNHLYMGIPGTEHTILVFSPEVKNFVGRWTGYDCNCFCELSDGRMLVGGEGYLYVMNDDVTDDGETINFSYVWPALYAGNPNINAAFRQIEGLVTHAGGPIMVFDYYYQSTNHSDVRSPISVPLVSTGVEWDSDEAIWDVASWAGSVTERFLTSSLTGRGKAMLLSMSNYTASASLEIEQLILRYKPEGIKVR